MRMLRKQIIVPLLLCLLITITSLLIFTTVLQAQTGWKGTETGPGTAGMKQQLTRKVAPDAGSLEAPLLFCIGIHIEPLGATVSPAAGGSQAGSPKGRKPPGKDPSMAEQERGGKGRGFQDYNEKPFFNNHVRSLKTLEQVVERHNGRMTVQAQSPFTSVSIERRETLLPDMEKKGHEIGLHFHEDSHLGRNCETLPPSIWTQVMKEEIELIKKTGVKKPVTYWSGGNLYPKLLDAASMAGLQVMSDHKNPRRQATFQSLISINPWRPSGGPCESNVDDFSRNNPNGAIIYLPDGIFPGADFRERKSRGDVAYFDCLTEGLEMSLKACRKDRINVFHITIHPGEFKGGERPFGIVDLWLTEVIDPLVKAGKVKWATYSEMADAYRKWEKKPSGIYRQTTAPAQISNTAIDITEENGEYATCELQGDTPSIDFAQCGQITGEDRGGKGFITFAVNVHDIRYPDESAKTLTSLALLFKKYGVHGDFYMTSPMVEAFQSRNPGVISTLKDTGMTISYHFRPPNPLYQGFDSRLLNLSDSELEKTVKDYETYRLDLRTGDLDRGKPGGYLYVKQVFGAPPVTVSVLNRNRRIKDTALKLYKSMGAKVTVQYHEEGTDLQKPFEWMCGLLVRPSDFSITRWSLPGEPKDSFWWNRLKGDGAAEFNPTSYLKKQLSAWHGKRPPFITVLIHDDNFYRKGATPWGSIYFSGRKEHPLSPPFDMNAPDQSHPRSDTEKTAMVKAYEELVEYASRNLTVVTSREIAEMAEKTK